MASSNTPATRRAATRAPGRAFGERARSAVMASPAVSRSAGWPWGTAAPTGTGHRRGLSDGRMVGRSRQRGRPRGARLRLAHQWQTPAAEESARPRPGRGRVSVRAAHGVVVQRRMASLFSGAWRRCSAAHGVVVHRIRSGGHSVGATWFVHAVRPRGPARERGREAGLLMLRDEGHHSHATAGGSLDGSPPTGSGGPSPCRRSGVQYECRVSTRLRGRAECRRRVGHSPAATLSRVSSA